MDLIGAVVDPSGALVAVPGGQDRVVGNSESAVDLDRGVHGFSVVFGGPDLNDLTVRQSFTLWGDLSLICVGTHEIEETLCNTEPAHAVMDTSGPKTLLGDCETGSLGTRAGLLRGPDMTGR